MKTTILTMLFLFFGSWVFAYSHNPNLQSEANPSVNGQQSKFSTNDILSAYLKLKNALVKSDSKAAAASANELTVAIRKSEYLTLAPAQKSIFDKWSEVVLKESKSIESQSGKLDKQRKSFKQLSESVRQLLLHFGTPQKLYLDYCPMFEGGATWISESGEIKNPYYGAQMLSCGKIKEKIE